MVQEKMEGQPRRPAGLDQGSTSPFHTAELFLIFTIIPSPLLLSSHVIFTPLVAGLTASMEAREVGPQLWGSCGWGPIQVEEE